MKNQIIDQSLGPIEGPVICSDYVEN